MSLPGLVAAKLAKANWDGIQHLPRVIPCNVVTIPSTHLPERLQRLLQLWPLGV